MKPSMFLSAPVLAAVLFCLVSCGENKDKKTDDTSTASDSTVNPSTSESAAPASTITTIPQNMMVVRHKVADFNKWMATYDAGDSMRLANGLHNYVISRGLMDTSMVQVSVRADDVNRAKAFAKGPDLKKAMQKSGVIGAPVITFTTMTFRDTGTIASEIRSRTTFTVKDWDQWQRSFDSSRQMRMDNGLVDRSYGHDADNNKKVIVVVALMDTAKAFAYWKSDELKKRMAASGVTGAPQRFLYRVVKRY